jgi:hypothetical protein
MLPNATDSSKKTFKIPEEYQMKPGTSVKLSAMVIAYAGYQWYYYLQSAAGAKSYTVSHSGLFPAAKNISFPSVCVLTANPDVITVNKKINASTPVNVTLKSLPDSRGNPVPIFAQIFYVINQSGVSGPLIGVSVMNKFSSIQVYSYSNTTPVLPGVTPSYSETVVQWWVTAMDNGGALTTSQKYEYRISAIQKIDPKFEKDIFVVQAVDDLQHIGIRAAPVSIRGTDIMLDTVTNDMGSVIPHEAGKPNVVLWLGLNNSYAINVTYAFIGWAIDVTYVLDKNPKVESKILKGREYPGYTGGAKKGNWSIALSVTRDGMRTIKFIFNIYSSKPLIFAQVADFPNSIFEYMTYATAIILLIPIVVLLDKRRKKAEEDEKRVTL